MWYEMSLLFVMSNSSKIVFTRRTPERKKKMIFERSRTCIPIKHVNRYFQRGNHYIGIRTHDYYIVSRFKHFYNVSSR